MFVCDVEALSLCLCVTLKRCRVWCHMRCRDLADLIYCGRLPCKIDAVRGIIEAVRMDSHNALYEEFSRSFSSAWVWRHAEFSDAWLQVRADYQGRRPLAEQNPKTFARHCIVRRRAFAEDI